MLPIYGCTDQAICAQANGCQMPGALQVCMHTCAELIASVPFLEDAEENFVRYLVTQLHPTVCTISSSSSL